ncbi:hypothetical protein AKJ35_00530 [candidate division MSBL1 archaeon SCGC-AAA833F18]|uniref:Uncharacterized protein n=1 Tax=candidate division MSBL1 archaeon SCGC-AAA833F18 TaxID=1698257 RepID=A0A133VT69_9EURY|nr:hypothetical protein AKJ35_00530 [candidate division MSBL1 archaeon SCGC-AAA833F18]
MNIEVLLPLVAPFLIGLLVGALVKKAMSLIVVGVALVIVLIATGALSLSYSDIYDKAMETLPQLWSKAQGLKGVLPYSSVSFLIGLAIGLWRG